MLWNLCQFESSVCLRLNHQDELWKSINLWVKNKLHKHCHEAFKLVPMFYIYYYCALAILYWKQHEFLESQTYVESYTTYGLPKYYVQFVTLFCQKNIKQTVINILENN